MRIKGEREPSEPNRVVLCVGFTILFFLLSLVSLSLLFLTLFTLAAENLADTLYESKIYIRAGDRYEQAAREMVEKGSGVFSHPVGMAVHDDGDYNYRRRPLAPGVVFSVDPSLWVREENLYLRYEDTVVVTETGVENFTDFLPSELDDLEALMREDGVVQKVPAVSEWPK